MLQLAGDVYEYEYGWGVSVLIMILGLRKKHGEGISFYS